MPPLCRTGPFACTGTAPVLSLLRVDRLSLCGLSIEAPAASRYDLAAIGAARWRQRAGRQSALAHRCRRGAHSTEWLPHHAGAAHCSHSLVLHRVTLGANGRRGFYPSCARMHLALAKPTGFVHAPSKGACTNGPHFRVTCAMREQEG